MGRQKLVQNARMPAKKGEENAGAPAPGPPLASPKRRAKDDTNPHFTPQPPAPKTWNAVAGLPLPRHWQQHSGSRHAGLQRSSTFDKYTCRQRWEGGPSADSGRFVPDAPAVPVPRGDPQSMSPRRVTLRRFQEGKLSWTDRRAGKVAGAMQRAMKGAAMQNASTKPCRLPSEATSRDWALATTRQGQTAPQSEYALPPIRNPGETWASYFARVPDAVAPGTEALLAAERQRFGKGISEDLRESSLGAAEALGRQAELTAVRHDPAAALKRAVLRVDADLAREALLRGADPNARVLLGRRRRADARESEDGAGVAGGFDSDLDFDSFLDESLNSLLREGAMAEQASRLKPNRVPVLHLLARRVGAVRSFTDTHVSAARGKTRRQVYDTGWTHTSVEDPYGDELWFAVNLLDPKGEKIWARSELEAKTIATEREAERLQRGARQYVDIKHGMVKRQYPTAPTNYQESIPESMVLPIVRMLLELPTVDSNTGVLLEHRNAWRDENGRGGKADVDAVDVNGNTALHEAARRGASGVIELLLQAKVDIHATNDQGQTAYDLATDSECKFLLLRTVKEARRVQKAVGSLRTLTMFSGGILGGGAGGRLGSSGGSTLDGGNSLPPSRGSVLEMGYTQR